MKTTVFVASFLSLALPLVVHSATAGIAEGLGVWEGYGTARPAEGGAATGFSVSVTRKALGATKVRAEGKVRLSDGKVIDFWQDIEDAGQGAFRVVSSNGTGKGFCFQNGMCQSYEERADGHAFSTTVALDTPQTLRILVTELDKGRAVRFIDQSLMRKP